MCAFRPTGSSATSPTARPILPSALRRRSRATPRQRGDELKLVVIPDNATRADGQHLPFHFDQSLGVRKDDAQLLAEINAALEKARPEIESILKDEGIPLDELAEDRRGTPRMMKFD